MPFSPMRSSINKVVSDPNIFSRLLLAWYDTNARDLPWRKDHDPYCVWVSEIMLQQTRVAAVIEHYYEFLRRFPTVQKLAAAWEASVLAAWSGLGYYRRARMMHAAAKVIVRKLGGKFPTTSTEWRDLPGIGRYTAAAIASIAFGEPIAVVDGNVERVVQRLLGRQLKGEDLWREAENLLNRSRPGDFNQAMMELGATICTPRAPTCLACPLIDLCATRGEHAVNGKALRQVRREIHYALNRRNQNGGPGDVFLVQRARDASLMPGMWELPEIPAHEGGQPLFTVRHSITVTDYTVKVWQWTNAEPALGKWIATAQLPKVALTGLTRKILRKAEII